MLMQDVVILATGVNVHNNLPRTLEKEPNGRGYVQTTLTGDTKYATITIEAYPQLAQDLILLSNTNPSALYFLLRNPHDRKPTPRMMASSIESIQSKTIVPSPSGFSYPTQPNYNNNPGR